MSFKYLKTFVSESKKINKLYGNLLSIKLRTIFKFLIKYLGMSLGEPKKTNFMVGCRKIFLLFLQYLFVW